MKTRKLGIALTAAMLAAAPFASFAQEAEEDYKPFSGTLGATTDYVWRGQSQTMGDPAFQAGLTYTAPFGLYVGTWGSNVQFEGVGKTNKGWENDWFLGYNTDIGENFNLDVLYNYYSYPGKEINGDFGELIVKGTLYKHVTGTVAYSDNFGNTKGSSVYYQLGTSWELPQGFGVSAGVGRNTFESKTGLDDYTDYSVGLSKAIGPGSLGVTYTDTSIHGSKYADGRVAVSFTISL